MGMRTDLAPPRVETLLPILQQVGSAVWSRDLGGHHVPAHLVGGSHCHRSCPLPPALRDLQEARCVAVVSLGFISLPGQPCSRGSPSSQMEHFPSVGLGLASTSVILSQGLKGTWPLGARRVRILEGLAATYIQVWCMKV